MRRAALAGGAPYIAQVFAAAGQVAGVQRKRHLGAGEEAFTAATCGPLTPGPGSGWPICAESGRAPFDAAAAGARLCRGPRPVRAAHRGTFLGDGFAWWSGADARRHARRLGLWIGVLAGQAHFIAVDEDFPGLAALVGPDWGGVTARLPDS